MCCGVACVAQCGVACAVQSGAALTMRGWAVGGCMCRALRCCMCREAGRANGGGHAAQTEGSDRESSGAMGNSQVWTAGTQQLSHTMETTGGEKNGSDGRGWADQADQAASSKRLLARLRCHISRSKRRGRARGDTRRRANGRAHLPPPTTRSTKSASGASWRCCARAEQGWRRRNAGAAAAALLLPLTVVAAPAAAARAVGVCSRTRQNKSNARYASSGASSVGRRVAAHARAAGWKLANSRPG
eukprot:350687-Chlamydomonas_euryale.AAC.4